MKAYERQKRWVLSTRRQVEVKAHEIDVTDETTSLDDQALSNLQSLRRNLKNTRDTNSPGSVVLSKALDHFENYTSSSKRRDNESQLMLREIKYYKSQVILCVFLGVGFYVTIFFTPSFTFLNSLFFLRRVLVLIFLSIYPLIFVFCFFSFSFLSQWDFLVPVGLGFDFPFDPYFHCCYCCCFFEHRLDLV